MTSDLWIRDLAAFAFQVTVLIIVGAAVWRMVGVHRAVATFGYWRALLAGCLLLPVCQSWLAISAPPIDALVERAAWRTDVAALSVALPMRSVAVVTPRSTFAVGDAVLVGLLTGMAVRSAWLVLGIFRLRRLRRDATLIDPLPGPIRDAEAQTGARADVYVSNAVSGPITFGLRRPVIVLPPAVLAMEASLQLAIAGHELLHVRRRDWLQVIGEEVIRTVFWFHPAVWWLINRIQLSREHVVDEAVIGLTQARDHYVEALLAVAVSRTRSRLVPATLFLRRRFLKRRVAQILQETTMTTRRLMASVTASACALMLAAIFAVRAFPIEARSVARELGAQPSTSAPIQIVTGGEHLLHGTLPQYPRRAVEQRIEGDVVVALTIDERGEVSDASVMSGPAELRRAALESVLQWHYSPEALRSTSAQATFRFRVPGPGEERAGAERGFAWNVKVVEAGARADEMGAVVEQYKAAQRHYVTALQQLETSRRDGVATPEQGSVEELKRSLREYEKLIERFRAAERESGQQARFEAAGPLARIRTERLSEETANAILSRAGVRIGDPLTETAANRIREAAKSVDEHLRVSFERDTSGFILFIIAP